MKRCVLIPVLQGVVWAASIAFSIFFDFGGIYPNEFGVRNVLGFGIIILFFEMLAVCLDIKFALEGFVIDKDLSFALQSKVIPLVVVSLCLLANAIANVGSFQLVLLILFLTFSKISILHAQAMIDENRIPEFSPPLKIQEF